MNAAACRLLSIVLALGAARAAGASECPIEVHGFLLGAISGRTTGAPPLRGGDDFVLGEERVRLDLSGASESGAMRALVKVDLFHDAVANRVDDDLREAYAGYTSGPFDVRLGRQIITWGVGDLFFINDTFPKDWESFFSGRPMEYLKLGVDGAQTRYSSDLVNAELVAAPFFFTADRLPAPERFSFFDPFSGVPNQREVEAASRLSNTELALRLYRQVADFDVSLYGYRGFWRTPSVRVDNAAVPTAATRWFPELVVAGASAQRSALAGVVSLEVGYYDSRDDRRGSDPAVPNSQWRFLAGYQREVWEDFVAGVQAYGELMMDYGPYRRALPAGSPQQDEFRGVASMRLTQLLDYQTWRLSAFAAYSPTDADYFLQPEASYKLTDRLSVAVGANVFGGQHDTTFFGQFERSDNAFSRVRFDF
ncbi:MAG: hypothetical protein HY699_09325 [Deltaproteobacteria bacterium]|nr:hypothetical protein [Deltaproteobacteria bacterium]